MQSHLIPRDGSDKSPLLFYKSNWLKGRVRSNYQSYLKLKSEYPLRLDSNHLLIALLSSLTSTFHGDLIDYTGKVENEVRRLAGVFKLTTAAVKGKVHESVIYNGVSEIITLSSSTHTFIDLWWDWRDVSPVTIHNHPFTQLELFDPIVNGSPELRTDEVAYINIDLPLMAAQYRMYRASYPTSNKSNYITQVVLPAMMKSHLDLVLFNKVLVTLGILEPTKIKTNIPMQQPTLDKAADDLAEDIIKGLLKVPLEPRQVLNSIPTLYSDLTALDAARHPDILGTQQSKWAIHSQAINKAKLVLTVAGQRNHFDRALPLLNRIRRNNVHIHQEGWYRSRLTSADTILLMNKWSELLDLLPPDYSVESFEWTDTVMD